MTLPTIKYDVESDTLYISFIAGGKGTGIELNDHILLRWDKETNTAVGLTIFEYSLLAPQTEMGDTAVSPPPNRPPATAPNSPASSDKDNHPA